ncbi:MAG: MerR family transcriptional regulator [Anaerolineae bacterium]
MNQEEPIYNIGVVSRMTDIPAATLRVWERRYDFPDTARTEGGHRLYSEKDIERIRWVKARVDEGMQTRQAVRALRTLEEEGTFPEPPRGISQSPLPSLQGGPDPEADVDTYLELLQGRLSDALVQHDIARADGIFDEALVLYTPEEIMLQLIRPTLTEIGEQWFEGKITIGTEHLTTSYLRQRLMVWLRIGPPTFSVQPTVLACAPGEYHEGSLMIFGALMRRRRWPIAYLGQSIPLSDLAEFAKKADPLSIVLVAMTEEPAEAMASWPEHFPDVAKRGRPIFAFGGRVFNEEPEWRARIQGLFLGATLTEGVETLERTLRRYTPPLE